MVDQMKTLLTNLFWLGLWSFATACGSKIEVKAQDLGPLPEQAAESPTVSKLAVGECVDPDLTKVQNDVSLTLCNGELAQGLLELPQVCTADGVSGCVTTDAFKSADMNLAVATNIKTGATIAGISGSVAESPAICSADGGVGCVVLGPTFKAADMSNFVADSIRSGITVAGVVGSLANCASDGASSCVVDGATYKAAATATAVAGNIKKGVSIAGATGDYPSATYPLAGANAAVADLDDSTFNAKIKSSADFEWFDSTGNSYTRAGEPHIAAGLILNGVSIFGTVGSYVPGSMSVSSLTATKDASKVALSWTRSGGSGVMIVRRAGASVSFTPTHGVNYAQGNTYGDYLIVYRGSAATLDDTNVVDGTTYYYRAFAYNGDNGYSLASSEALILYADWDGTCGAAGNSCYSNAAAIAAGAATTPLGKSLVYVTASGAFKVWKDAGSNKILRANGLDEWAMKLNLNGKGFQGAGNEFTDYASLEGRKCPPSVYIDDNDKVSENNCLYYTVVYDPQRLNAAGTSQEDANTLGLNNWSNYNAGGAKWYVGNIKTCSDIGMRLPTIFETTTTETSDIHYPSDATPTFAGATNGIPSHPSNVTWTASSYTNTAATYYYWKWHGASLANNPYNTSSYVRCALP